MSPAEAKRCPKCATEVRADWRICPACEVPLGPKVLGDETTMAQNLTAGPGSTSVEEGRFPAGMVLAGRYRIIGLLGQGGMGEVYRAYDLILNQGVALKFLSQAVMSEAMLARFRNEVRIARQVSHPNVCRVYDIGFIEGSHFLSMEYLDGEDLSSLIRRIGRLPQDKAIEFARRICAGLAAAHERGVLHRDLKPANIMIDSRGQVRITDFGLAVLAQEVQFGDIRSGTPAYMAPEQKEGREVTIRSDLYSLGATLYEMFTGKRRTDAQSQPSEIVKDLDPAVERIILRCLEEDPKRRPSSALGVAMALPGGDPIAAALAAGETPSPEMVAASEEKEGFSSRTAILCVVGIIAAFVLLFLSFGKDRPLGMIAVANLPPDVLAYRAQVMLRDFGYPDDPGASAWGFDCCDGQNLSFVNKFAPAKRDELLASHRPPVLRFWYRQNRGALIADSYSQRSNGLPGVVSWDEPRNDQPGMVRVHLDATGRLYGLEGRPEREPDGIPAPPLDWNKLFQAAQLDPARFASATPVRVPPMAFDAQMAWTGTYSGKLPERIRVEVASWKGRPVFFDVSGDWVKPEQSSDYRPSFVSVVFVCIQVMFFCGAVFVARRNLRMGRGDRKGAWVVAIAAFSIGMAGWAFQASHVASSDEVGLVTMAIWFMGYGAGLVWLGYLAVEPYARKHWPDSLISWNRFIAGRLRDPLVASHILAGSTVFFAGVSVIQLLRLLVPSAPSVNASFASLSSNTAFLGVLTRSVSLTLVGGVEILLLVVLARLLLRVVWIADLIVAILMVSSGISVDYSDPLHFVVAAAGYIFFMYCLLFVLRRCGFLAVMAFFLTNYIAVAAPPLPLNSWFRGGWICFGLLVAIPAWALWVILSAQQRTAGALSTADGS